MKFPISNLFAYMEPMLSISGNKILKGLAAGIILTASCWPTLPAYSANEPLVIPPLFDYPAAPDSIEGLQERSDFLMDNFWKPMDFGAKKSVDQNALNHAFSIYAIPMQFASAEKVGASIQSLTKSVAKNPVLALQLTKAAEENLYGPRAPFWSDELYLKFIDALLANKGVKKERKLRYERIRKLISNTMQGTVPPDFDYIRADGSKAHYSPNGVITVIEFGDPGCTDCQLAKLRLDTDPAFTKLVEQGKVNVLFIYSDPEEGWEEKLKTYPSNWHVGASEETGDLYDMRLSPSIYVIDRKGRVAVKNTDVRTAIDIAVAAANQ